MKNKITVSKPTNMFGSAITETTIGFPAMKLLPEQIDEFIAQLQAAKQEANA